MKALKLYFLYFFGAGEKISKITLSLNPSNFFLASQILSSLKYFEI